MGHFFTGSRQHFFRTPCGKYRAMAANCLQALYLRLHGPEADYRTLVTREELVALLLPVIRDSPILEADGSESEEESGENERLSLFKFLVIRFHASSYEAVNRSFISVKILFLEMPFPSLGKQLSAGLLCLFRLVIAMICCYGFPTLLAKNFRSQFTVAVSL